MAFPNVPDVDGVPPLSRAPGSASPPPVFLQEDEVTEFGESTYPLWGLFLNGEAAVTAETVLGVEYKQDWAISSYPVEEGAFQSYNKVDTPYSARVQFSTGGSEIDRTNLLRSIAEAAASLELYDLVTPEVTYSSVNISHYDYRRTSFRGVGLLIVDVWVEEVRETGTTAFSSTKSPSGASPVDGGVVQTDETTQDEEDLMEEVD